MFLCILGPAPGRLLEAAVEEKSRAGASLFRRERLLCLANGAGAAEEAGGPLAVITPGAGWHDAHLARLAADADPARALLRAWDERGDRFVEAVAAPFSLALYDPAAERMLLAVDRIGQRSAVWTHADGHVVAADSLRTLLALTTVRRELRPQALYDYMFLHMVPSPETAYAGISRLRGGHLAELRADGARVRPYWLPRFSEGPPGTLEDATRELHEVLSGAIARADRPEETGTFLSGGLDSSTVTGLTAGLRDAPVHSFSIGFDEAQYDESAYARAAAERFGTMPHTQVVQAEDTAEAIPEVAAWYDEPFGNSSAVPALLCARLARGSGMRALLAGDGGDELFGGNERYATQKKFEIYAGLPRPMQQLVRAGALAAAALPGPAVLRKPRSYVEQASVPLPDRFETYNFLVRHAADEVFEPGFLAQVDTEAPLRYLRELYQAPEEASALNRMLYLDWYRTLQDNDLVKVSQMCELAGIEVHYPMLDDAVVDFSTRIPSRWKLKGHTLRWFFKQAVTGFLPEQIIHKQKHGFGLPFGLWAARIPSVQDMAYGRLADLEQRGIFRPDFLARARESHQTVHAAYYGELVWILLMLELWLAHHETGGASATGGIRNADAPASPQPQVAHRT